MTVSLTDSSHSFGVGAEARWTYGDGSTASSSPEHEFEVPGTYTICLTLTATAGQFCTASYCRDVVVPSTPCPSSSGPLFEFYLNGTNSSSFQFTTGISLNGSWYWDFGDGSTSNEALPTHTWALPGPHFVTLTEVANGCLTTYGRWVTVDGNGTTCGPGLFVDFMPAAMDQLEMSFVPNILTSGISTVLGIWSFGDGTVDTAFVAQHQYEEPGSYQVCFLVGALSLPAQDTCFSLVCHTFETASVVGVAESDEHGLLVWPIPAHDLLQIRAPRSGPSTVRLFDMDGRTVLSSMELFGPITTIPVNTVSPGPYVLEVDQDGLRSMVRILVQH